MTTNPKPRQRLDAAERRREIIAVATRQISERGYRGVTLEAIAQDVGISKAGVQHHFPSKDDLLIAVLEARDAEELQYADRQLLEFANSEEFLEGFDQIVARNFERREIIQLFTVLGAEALDESHPAHEYFQRRMNIVQDQFRTYMHDWFVDPEKSAIDFMSYLDGLQLAWLRDPTIDLRAHAATFMRLLLEGEKLKTQTS
jgi:AcrR family transcriptional regulator